MLHTTSNGKVTNGIVTSMQSPIPPHSSLDSVAAAKRIQERENLSNIIAQWNANRLDLFEISEPNEDLEFYGVMRFYFQDAGQKVATKCMRISSTASTMDVISNLIEKFRPDIRMLSVPEYALYEIHENGEERKLADEEMPLLVQLNWHKDDREGRFLLRRMDEKTYLPGFSSESSNILNRKLSKREKKEKKKREKKEKAAGKANGDAKGKDSLAEKLYTELPETSFTRSISNPEAVMRRRRQQKLEKKLQQFSQEGGSEAGGTLRIFGESINQDVPYKTILLSTKDTTAFAVKEILEKYGKEKEDHTQYCLVQMIVPYLPNGETNGQQDGGGGTSIRECILDDDDCPLIIERNHVKSRGVLTFHIRRRPPDYQPRKRKKKPADFDSKTSAPEDPVNGSKVLPFLVEVNPDGSEISRPNVAARRHYLYMNVTEVGSEVSNNNNNGPKTNRNSLQLFGPNVQPRHCVIAHTEGIVTVTPCSRDAETTVNGTRIYETTILKHGMMVRFGKLHTFKFIDEMAMRRHSQLSTGAIIGQHFQQQQQQQQQTSNISHQAENATANVNAASYETTFDADGKVETKPSANTDTGSFNSGSLQRHHTVGSLPRSTNGPNGSTAGGGGNAMNNANANQPRPPVNYNSIPRKGDNILPAILEVWEEIEDLFLNMIIKRVDPNHVQFKLCITYCLYMVTRYRASTYFKPEITPEIRASRLIAFCIKYANLIQQSINEHHRDQPSLAFWLANSSELLHFLKHDRHLSAFTFDSQDILAESVQMAFTCLVNCQQHELQEALITFTTDMVDQSDDPLSQMTGKVLNVLSNSMQLLRRFRVNAALTIQLFSQLFHFINMWLFNKVIGTPESNFCSRHFGNKLRNCLVQIELWAEKQGLELAAECHLSRIVQTAQFLRMSKNQEELSPMVVNFFKLNSLQLRALFERYQPMPDEMPFGAEQIESVIKMARSTTDELILKDGREIRLEEEMDLQLPFLLPEDGYSCDIVRGIPAGLQDFVQTLVQAHVCNLTIQPTASGYWTIYFINFQPDTINQEYPSPEELKNHMEPTKVVEPKQPISNQQQAQMLNNQGGQFMRPMSASMQALIGHKPPMMPMPAYTGFNTLRAMPEPEVQVIKLQKSNNGIGLSIVAARGTNQSQLGIYIKSVVKGGAADLDGRLEAGDQLLKVDGHSLIGITQERAAELMTQTGPIVTLEVAKQGALYHGLGGILSQQSSTSLLNKNIGNLRFVPNSQEYGPPPPQHRLNGHVNPLHPQFSPQHHRLPTYNSMPSMAYSQLPPNYRTQPGNPAGPPVGPNMAINYNNAPPNMRPDSQLSYNSQTNAAAVLNQPVNTAGGNRVMSTSNIPVQPQQPPQQQQQQQLPQFHEERHYQNIQLYQLNKNQFNGNQIPKQSTIGPRPMMHPMSNGTLRPQSSSLIRSGPPPPAPKPARPSQVNSAQPPPTQVSCRYGPSGYPSKSQPLSSINNSNHNHNLNHNNRDMHSGVSSPSPWEREEKEKEMKQKFEDTKRSRDDEIKHLESLPYRNPKNEERLRKLILEREFQKRAEEHFDDEEEEDDEVLERADQRERLLSLKQDIEKTRLRRMEQRYGAELIPSNSKLNKTLEEHQERLKQLRREEEAVQQAEERLLQEAKKRQEDEQKQSKGILKQAPQSNNEDIPPPLPNSPPPMETANQRLDRLISSTALLKTTEDEPIIGAAVVPVRTGVLKNSTNYDGTPTVIADKSVKKVSWNDNPSTSVLSVSDQSEEAEEDEEEEPQEDRFSLQDIDDVLGTQAGNSKDWLNNYVSGGNTPGVIGAQEVYNDPRKRIEAERMKSNLNQSSSDKVLPEKLSFQEKMKMFAKSTGEMIDETNVRNKLITSKPKSRDEQIDS